MSAAHPLARGISAVLFRTLPCRPLLVIALFLCVVVSFRVASVRADVWIDPAGGDFDDGANWLDGTAPTAIDSASFDLAAGPYTVTLTQNQTVTSFGVQDDEIDFDLGGFKLDANLANGFGIGAGLGNDATVSFSNGLLETTGSASIGGSGNGSLTFSGPSMHWDNSATVSIANGSGGDGSVTFENGATATANGWTVGTFSTSTAALTVTGSGSMIEGSSLLMGLSGAPATVTISNGGVVETSLQTRIDPSAVFLTTLEVTGQNSQLRGIGSAVLRVADVGSSGTATLVVEEAGRAAFPDLEVAQAINTTGLVTIGIASGGVDAVLDISDDALIGRGVFDNSNTGTAIVTVNAGGHFIVDDVLRIGGNGTVGSGTLNVFGGSVTATNMLIHNTGTLNFTAGQIEVGAMTTLGDLALTGGTALDNPTLMTQAGGAKTINGDLFIGGDSGGPGNPGSAIVFNASLNATGDAHIYPNGLLHLTTGGIVAQHVAIDGDVILETNVFSGITAQSISITSALNWSSGRIYVQGPAGVSTNDFPDDNPVFAQFNVLEVTNATTVQAGDSLTIDGGEVITGAFNVGVNDVSNEPLPTTVLVDGATSLLHVTGDAYVAGSAAGESNFGFVQTTNSGQIDVDGDLVVYSMGHVVVGAATSVNVDGTLTLHGVLELPAGETLSADRILVPDGTFFWTGGNLTIGEGDLHVGTTNNATASNLGADTVIPNALSLTLPGEAVVGQPGVTGAGSLTIGDGAALNTGANKDTTIDSLGSVQLNNGAINSRRLNVRSGGELSGNGTVEAVVLADLGSTITATGNLELGKVAAFNGFYSNGDLMVESGTTTLRDANTAVFDSAALVTLGDAGTPGTLAAANGLTLDFGGNISGFGTVDTLDNAAKPLVNNGHIGGNSGTEPITLTGYVKGVGTLDNVVITGTDAPGFSPASVVRGSVVYDGTLEIEIGGTAPGSFDQINHLLGAGVATLGGLLDVELTGGFRPDADDTFEIMSAASFGSVPFVAALPELYGGLFLDVVYDATTVTLVVAGLPGDYNYDNIVDAADYTVWRNTLNDEGDFLNADGDGDRIVDEDDYNVWRMHYGESLPGGGGGLAAAFASQAAVPEPAASWLAALAIVLLLPRRWQETR